MEQLWGDRKAHKAAIVNVKPARLWLWPAWVDEVPRARRLLHFKILIKAAHYRIVGGSGGGAILRIMQREFPN